jgi:hypothetical protein
MGGSQLGWNTPSLLAAIDTERTTDTRCGRNEACGSRFPLVIEVGTSMRERERGATVSVAPRSRVGTSGDQWKLSPHAQLPCAFGLSIVKPCFWMVSSKSIVAPSR